MNALIDAAISRRRTMLLTLALILISGSLTYITIPKEAEPDVPIPIVYVSMYHEGISPEDSERLLARPMEQELRSVEGVKEMRSAAHQGYASVTLEFEAGFENEKALNDVREKVDMVKPKLPDDTDEPRVHEVNVALFPVLVVTLSGAVPERTLLHIARRLRDDVESVPGVLEAKISGEREEMIEIVVDPLLMDSYGISQEELFSLVARNNRLIAAGNIEGESGRFAVKVPGVFESVEEVQQLPVKVIGHRVVHFGDIASITRNFKDPTSFARKNGERAVTLEISKRIGANIIETLEIVRRVVDYHQQQWPSNLDVSFSQDKSDRVKTMLADLRNNVLTAVLLVVIVIIGILGWRSASLVAVAIPGSFLAGILALDSMGLTINIVVLFSLIMAVGMLVDGAIVVVELADRRMCEGMPRREAFSAAAKRMAWPIIASTATTLAAFTPLIFWPGIMGEFMKFLPITLIATLTASLFMALIFVPTLGSIFGQRGASSERVLKKLAAAEVGDIAAIDGAAGVYVKTLRWVTANPFLVLILSIFIAVGSFIGYAKLGPGVEFFPDVEPDNARVIVRARGDLSIFEMDRVTREVERRILDVDGVKSFYARSGKASGGGQRSGEDVVGVIQLELAQWNTRPPAVKILAAIRARTADMTGVIIEAQRERSGPQQGKPVKIQLSTNVAEPLSASNARLGSALVEVRKAMTEIGGFVDVEDTRPLPGIEWQMEVDRAQAARFGADITLVGNAIQMVTSGIKLGDYHPEDTDEEIDIRARYSSGGRHIGQLDTLRIQTREGLVPASNFVERVAAPKVGKIDRIDSQRVMIVESDVETGLLVDRQVKAMKQHLADQPLETSGVNVTFKGDDEDQAEASSFLKRAFLVALFVMTIILVTQFNSFYQSFLILSAVIFSTAAVFLGLMVMQQPFGIVMGGIGVISLAGVVVNNNIVLIDTFNVLRDAGMPAQEAVMRTGAQRLRPVMLTTVTTILGLLPMVFGLNVDLVARVVEAGGPSSQWWTQLASVVAGGLAFATPITLLLTPALLMIQARREDRLAGRVAASA